MPDQNPISEQDASRLLDALQTVPYFDAETDEQIDADIAGLLPPAASAALRARLRADVQLDAIYRERKADAEASLTPAHVAEVSARIHEQLREQFPELRPATPPHLVGAGEWTRRCSEALREITELFRWKIVFAQETCTTPPTVIKSGDGTVACATVSRPARGVRFVVTSANPKDENLQLEFGLLPSGSWRKIVVLERSMPGIDVWEAMLELSAAEVQSLSGDTARKLRVRVLP